MRSCKEERNSLLHFACFRFSSPAQSASLRGYRRANWQLRFPGLDLVGSRAAPLTAHAGAPRLMNSAIHRCPCSLALPVVTGSMRVTESYRTLMRHFRPSSLHPGSSWGWRTLAGENGVCCAIPTCSGFRFPGGSPSALLPTVSWCAACVLFLCIRRNFQASGGKSRRFLQASRYSGLQGWT